MATFGSELRRLREEAGFSQRSLAKKLGCNYTYISRLESGASFPPGVETIEAIAQFFQIEPIDLYLLAGRLPKAIEQQVIQQATDQVMDALRVDDQARVVEVAIVLE